MGAAAFLCIFRERVSGRQLLELRGGGWGGAVWLGWLELRALNLAAMIDYFWSTFGVRGPFLGGGRQDSGILLVFCLLFPPCGLISIGSVDKFQTFCSVFVYSCLRAGRDAQWQPISAYFYGQTAPKQHFVRNPVLTY